jgi:hypothetical protein
MEPESYTRLVRCPVLFLDATNDQHGKMDWAFKTLTLVPANVRWAFTPRHRHHIAAEHGINLPLWMDALELEPQGGAGAEPVFRTFRWVEPLPK